MTPGIKQIMYLKLQKIIVLYVTSIVLRPVQSMETGYTYSDYDIVDVARHRDLKCGYLFSGITHLRVIKKIFGHPSGTMEEAMTALGDYNAIIKYEIATLFELEGVNVGALFVLHLYSSMVSDYYNTLKKTVTDEMVKSKIVILHNYVTEKLLMEVSRCRKDLNRFDWDDHWAAREQVPNINILKMFIKLKNNNILELLKKNNKNGQIPYDTLDDALRPEVLLMKKFVFIPDINRNWLNAYKVNVYWADTEKILSNAYVNATLLDWTSDNLQDIRLYYTLIFAVFKVIMFRLTMKHLGCLHIIATERSGVFLIKKYTKEWYKIVDDFGKTLHINNDPHIKLIMVGLKNMMNAKSRGIKVMVDVQKVLSTYNPILGCVANNWIKLDGAELNLPQDSSSGNLYIIKQNSLDTAKAFLLHLNKVNFRIIRLLMEYIVSDKQ